MALNVSYMGTKRHMAQLVADQISCCRQGPLLDVFSGMCAIGRAVGPRRPVWSNDLQVFASEVARAQFCVRDEPPNAVMLINLARPIAETNMAACTQAFAPWIERERSALASDSAADLGGLFTDCIEEGRKVDQAPSCRPQHSVLTARFAGSYFGFSQTAQADSIRFGIDTLRDRGQIGESDHRWASIALCAALARVTTATGHFAQPLEPKKTNFEKFRAQRKRATFDEWALCLAQVAAIGTPSWREGNRSFRGDATDILDDLRSEKVKPAVVYADPPYTRDQYSRYYHLFETVMLYDDPVCRGKGLYRDSRAISDFSKASAVEESIDQLIRACRTLNADMVLSYPSNGLLSGSQTIIPRMISEHFGRQPEITSIEHKHSTMGASKGRQKHDVSELLYKVCL